MKNTKIIAFILAVLILIMSVPVSSGAATYTPQEPFLRVIDAIGAQVGVALAPNKLETISNHIQDWYRVLNNMIVEGSATLSEMERYVAGENIDKFSTFPRWFVKWAIRQADFGIYAINTLIDAYTIIFRFIFGVDSDELDTTQRYQIPDDFSEMVSQHVHQVVVDDSPYFLVRTTPWYSANWGARPEDYKAICQVVNQSTPVYAFTSTTGGWTYILDLHTKYVVGTPSGDGYQFVNYDSSVSNNPYCHYFYPQGNNYNLFIEVGSNTTKMPNTDGIRLNQSFYNVYPKSGIISLDGRLIKVYKSVNVINNPPVAYTNNSYDPNTVARGTVVGGKFLYNSPTYNFESIHSNIGQQTNIEDSEVFIIAGDYIIQYIGTSHEVDDPEPSDPTDPTDPGNPGGGSGLLTGLINSILSGINTFFNGILNIIKTIVGSMNSLVENLDSLFKNVFGLFEDFGEHTTGFLDFLAGTFRYLPPEFFQLLILGVGTVIAIGVIRLLLHFL